MSNYFLDIETTGLDAVNDRITVIAVINEKGNIEVFSNENEEKILKDYLKWMSLFEHSKVKDNNKMNIWAKNGKGFDFPFLLMRMIKYDLYYPNIYVDIVVKDIDDLLPVNPKTKRVPSLKDTCKLLGLENKSSDGLSAIYMWKWRNYKPTRIAVPAMMGHPSTLRYNQYTKDVVNHTLWSTLINYCVQDAKLVKDIWERLR